MFNVPNQNGYTAKINKKMICAASEGKDACQGDSGGMYRDSSPNAHNGTWKKPR